METVIVTLILLATIVLLVTDYLQADIVAFGIMVSLMVTDILTPEEALTGFSHPAPLTVAMLFVVSKGLMRTGALDHLIDKVVKITKGSASRLLLLSLLLTGFLSAFINNTPVVILSISMIMAVCCEYGFSPSKFLIPISFMSILAGTGTLIGTSTNIIVSDLGAAAGMEPLGMFELSLLGIPIALLGAAFLYFFSFRLLKAHKEPVCELTDDENHRFISELLVQPASALVGRSASQFLCKKYPSIELYEIIRGSMMIDLQLEDSLVQAGDILLVKASRSDVIAILEDGAAKLPKDEDGLLAKPYSTRSLIVEVIVPPSSGYIGLRLDDIAVGLDADIHFLGIKRRHAHYASQKMSKLRVSVGDILMVQTPQDHIESLRASGDLIIVENVLHTIVNRKRAPLALGIFIAMILITTLGFANIMVAAMGAMFLMLLTRCLSLRIAYQSLDTKVLLLIIGTIALGRAMDKSGAADLYAQGFLSLFSGLGPQVVLSAFIFLTSALSLFLSNNSTAILLVPIAISSADALGVDARPLIVGLCFGASACYASPIGYQTNLLVYGPGGYTFMDYVRLGLPLNLMVWLVATLVIPLIWPF